jgi:non-heme chloroperoxidase
MFLEIVNRKTERGASRPPILFVHGAYVGAWCWEENFLGWFAERGYDAHAISLRGHGASAGRERLNDHGLADYADDVAAAAAQLPGPPILIGHSMGALVAQKYLERAPRDAAPPAVVLACPVPSFGVMPSSIALAFSRPGLFSALNAVATGGRVSPEAVREALFAGDAPPEVVSRCHQRMQRESRRALFDMSGWGLPIPWLAQRPPTLVLGAERDALIPAPQARATASLLRAEYRELPAIGHALMLDAGWEGAAQAIADWLGERGC